MIRMAPFSSKSGERQQKQDKDLELLATNSMLIVFANSKIVDHILTSQWEKTLKGGIVSFILKECRLKKIFSKYFEKYFLILKKI